MPETREPQYLGNLSEGGAEKPIRAKGEFGNFLEKIFNEYHSKLVALSKHKLIEVGIEENEAANIAEDIVSTVRSPKICKLCTHGIMDKERNYPYAQISS